MQLEIGSSNYRIDKLSPMNQFHIARRLSPVLFAMAKNMSASKGEIADAIMGAVEPAVQLLASMSNDEAEFIIYTCMDQVYLQQSLGGQVSWAKVLIGGRHIAFEDIDMQVMMKLVFACLKDNLGNFMDALPAIPPQSGAVEAAASKQQ